MNITRAAVCAALLIVWSVAASAQTLVAPAPAEADFTASDGVKIHYYTAGSSGSWVVLIHGYTDNAERMWFRTGIAPALAKNHRIVALDNRNHGKSDKPQPGGSGRAQDVVELMDHLKIDRAHIHGYSMGGGITAQLLAMIPHRFISAGFGGSGIQETDEKLRAQAAALDAALPKPTGEDAAGMDRFRGRVAKLRPATSAPVSASRPQVDLTKLEIPILAVNGSFDSPYAKTQRLWREARVFQNVILEGKTHLTAISSNGAPPLYIDSMVRFIDAYDRPAAAATTAQAAPLRLLNAPCTAGTQQIPEPRTGRTYLLDYPCDLKAGEKVTFILNLHGGGSSGTWQRRYFPAFEQKENYRLIVASPYSPTRRWSETDDAYLQNIVTAIVDAVGRDNVQSFWLAGHSQGGSTSRRIVCSDFFRSRVDGFLSLSGGRLGGAAPRAPNAGRPRQANATEPTAAPAATAAAVPQPVEPTCDFSHIFAIGEHEITSLPAVSARAQQYGCGARVKQPDIVDDKPGYVHDGGHQNPASKEWGRLPRPGRAEVFVYPGCRDGRFVADVVRMDKGHTEGLEPAVTEALVKMMVAVKRR